MFNFPAWVKIVLVFGVCFSMAYLNYLLFTSVDFIAAVDESPFLYGSAVAYFLVVIIFADFYWKQHRHLLLAAWLLVNL